LVRDSGEPGRIHRADQRLRPDGRAQPRDLPAAHRRGPVGRLVALRFQLAPPPGLERNDVELLPVQLARLCNEAFAGPRERILMKNIAMAGALAALLELDLGILNALLQETYGRKKALLDSNFTALRLGYEYAKENLA